MLKLVISVALSAIMAFMPFLNEKPAVKEVFTNGQSNVKSYEKIGELDGHPVYMIEFNLPEGYVHKTKKDYSEENRSDMKLVEELLSMQKPPIGPERFIQVVNRDVGDQLPWQEWHNGYLYAGILYKQEYVYAENGVMYFNYGRWLRGYDPDQIQPDALPLVKPQK